MRDGKMEVKFVVPLNISSHVFDK